MEEKAIENEIKKSYLEYAMSVIVNRAIPDVRDGLKPVQRRILYSMYENGFTSDKPYRKSARIVGEAMGKYHPHGDAAIYDSMARMSQDFSMRYTLIDGQGNFGSIDGDSPAAMRYTEARLNSLSELMLKDIEKETVPFRDNFDGSLKEPEYLPSVIPNLLINGTTGIAVGMATNMVPHNLREICRATIETVKNPEITNEELLKIVKGPDFPLGGIIYLNDSLIEAYKTGRGKVICRGEIYREEKKRIIITSLPYGVNKSIFLENLARKVDEGTIDGITDIRDESNKEGMRIVIKIREEDKKDYVINSLYNRTELEQSIGIINLVLKENRPVLMSLRQLIKEHISHRLDVITKAATYDLSKAREREHLLNGMVKALENIETVIQIIRKSRDGREASSNLQSALLLSENQAKAVLEMRLQRLTSMEIESVKKDLEEIRAKIQDLENILQSEERRKKILIEEMENLSERFGDERRTKIVVGEIETIREEDVIPEEESIVILTEKGFIKRVTVDEYNTQRRGGKGILTSFHDDDRANAIVHCSSHDNLLFFTNKGRMFRIRAFRIESKSRKGTGTSGSAFLKLDQNEYIINMVKEEREEDMSMVLATSMGYIKRIANSEILNARSSGVIVIKLEEGDSLSSIYYVRENQHIVVVSTSGKAASFISSEIRLMGRNARGVRSMKVSADENVLTSFSIEPGQSVLTVSSNGYGKRTEEEQFKLHHRGTTGVRIMSINEKTGKIVAAFSVDDKDNILIITEMNKTIRLSVETIREMSRNTQGVKLIDLSEGDRVVSVGKIDGDEE
ncbi:DNA gyrase subunit A [Caldiplasma sukawensis]